MFVIEHNNLIRIVFFVKNNKRNQQSLLDSVRRPVFQFKHRLVLYFF